jgi:hypothetical protein
MRYLIGAYVRADRDEDAMAMYVEKLLEDHFEVEEVSVFCKGDR